MVVKRKTNPNGVNQHTAPDPRQAVFLAYYLDPKSETFANALQSGIRAGFSKEYSESILSRDLDWLAESVGDNALLKKAEKRLNEILDFEPKDLDGKIDNALLANQMKAVILVTKGLGKSKYSERTEHTGKGGSAIEVHQITGMQIIKE